MKRISEIAEELKVSKQAVYYWIKKLGKDIQNHIYKDGNAKVIDDPGVNMIREKIEGKKEIERPFKVNNQYPVVRPEDKEKEALKDRIVDLKEQIEIMKYQLRSKDQQINRLQNLLDKSQDNIESLTGQVEKKGFMEKVKELFIGESVSVIMKWRRNVQ